MNGWESSSTVSAPFVQGAEGMVDTEGGPERASPACG